jgi:serine/threonine protein phosphatase PrpC
VKFKYFSIAGPKGQNQDAILPPFREGECSWCAIADGVGSSGFGGLAARTSIAVVKEVADSTLPMAELFTCIRKRLSEIAREQENEKSISTTLSVLRICGDQAFVGHLGDTRISHYRGSGVMVRSKDQTEVQKLLDEGVLSKNQALRYPRRNVLLSAMSSNREYDLYEQQFSVQKGDRILLTTDGFHSKLMRRQLADISSSRSDFEDFWSAVQDELSSTKFDDDASCLALEID